MPFDPKHRSRTITDGRERAGARAMLKAIGFTDADLARPMVGVANTWTETMPCNYHLRRLAGALVGTVPYMAPEQLRGQPADARSDVWALGIVLYEMATGQRPFQGQTGFELSAAILNQAPPPLPPAVPAPLGAVIERCLAKEPGQRYQQGSEVHAALEAVQSGAALPAWPAWRYALSRRRWLALTVAVPILAAILVALNVGGLRERLRGGAPRAVARLMCSLRWSRCCIYAPGKKTRPSHGLRKVWRCAIRECAVCVFSPVTTRFAPTRASRPSCAG